MKGMWRTIASRCSFINRNLCLTPRKSSYSLVSQISQITNNNASMLNSFSSISYDYDSVFSPTRLPKIIARPFAENHRRFMSTNSCSKYNDNDSSFKKMIDQAMESFVGVSEEKSQKVVSLFEKGDCSIESVVAESPDNLEVLLNVKFFVRMMFEKKIPIKSYFEWAFSRDDFIVTHPTILYYIIRVFTFLAWPDDEKYSILLWNYIKKRGVKRNSSGGVVIISNDLLNILMLGFKYFWPNRTLDEYAMEVFDMYEEFGCVHDFAAYYAAIVHCRFIRDDWWQFRLCYRMIDAGVLDNAEKVCRIIKTYCSVLRAPHLGYHVYYAFKDKVPNDRANHLLRCLAQEDGTLCLAMHMLDDLSSSCEKATIDVFSSVVSDLCQKGDVEDAHNLVLRMTMTGSPLPRNKAFHDVIKSRCKLGQPGIALGMLTTMEYKGLKPNADAYRRIIRCYLSKDGMMEQACKVLAMAEIKHPNNEMLKQLKLKLNFIKSYASRS